MFKRSLLALLTIALFAVQSVSAQELPAPSPSASVTQKVGVTSITIDYSSPAVKGRKVFGELEPYGKAWRAGANAPTAITFSSDVKIGGSDVKAGTYNIFMTPQESSDWDVHFNGKGKSIFAYNTKEGQDMAAIKADNAASVSVKATEAPFKERLTYLIEAASDTEGKITLWWDKTMVTFTVTVPTAELTKANIEASLKDAGKVWRTYQNSAKYYAESDPTKAMELIDMSIATRSNYFWNQWTKAQFLAKENKFDEALDFAIAARKAGEAKPDGAYNFFKPSINKDIEAWLPNASKKWKKANKDI